MSQPARKLNAPSRTGPPARRPSSAPVRKAGSSEGSANRRSPAKRRVHFGFAIFAALVIALMIGGVVAMNAMLDQRAFRISALQQQVSDLQTRGALLTEQAAALDAPGRLGEWARTHGLTMPPQGDVVILGASPRASSGGGA
jgi:hypothetical protein